MAKLTNRDKLLQHGLRVVHEHGLGAASVRDIVTAAGVPQGSFSNHFASKEAFGLEILEMYFANGSRIIAETLRNDALPPLTRLGKWIDLQVTALKKNQMRNGCMYGNFSAEASEHSDAIRARILEIFRLNTASVAYCLQAAIDEGTLVARQDVEVLAGFVVSSLQGAILMAKATRSSKPIERFTAVLFSSVLG